VILGAVTSLGDAFVTLKSRVEALERKAG
jgi:hypothetical protein